MNLHQDLSIISSQEQTLIKKIRTLTPERIVEVENFVDFLRHRNEEIRLTHSLSLLSEATFQKIWDNPEDADYDRL
ncbi:MAG: toxin-antitoxin system, antitoxin component, Xre family protein [Desulfobacteraceae bacterium]|nr:MAG: toxin-antitoxin system, antitoxin component, Xre family protein [Desulfobacteraceae bacterium]